MQSENHQPSQPVKRRKSKALRRDDPERRTYSVEEAGRILGISRGAAYALARAGELPVLRLGGRLLILRAAFDRMLGIA